MNMGLLAADLSLGRSVKESAGSVVAAHHHARHREKQHLLYPCDLHALQVYHKALEDERLKIQAFERELPFCMQLLEDAIEASRDQLEERLACKLNTPLHEPQLAAATQEFICNYTSSLSHRSSLPALGEINLRFKRKWTSMPSSSTHDCPRSYNHAASACTTKWLLPQNTKLVQNEDSPITIKGSIKLQEFSIPEHVLPAAADQPQKTSSQNIGWDTKSRALNCVNGTTPYTHALHLHNGKQTLYSSVSGHQQVQADKYMASKMQQDVPMDDDVENQRSASAMPVRSINEMASLDANHSPSPYSRALSLTNINPQALQISTAMCSTLSQTGSHANIVSTTVHSGGVQRKPRRCWSPELHQRFLSALNHLGGCQVATPKQIRELMNVEGLTNDEVKSHLQKFRLHMRRPNGVLANSQGDAQQASAAGHHLVVFGHIWVPPEYGDQHHQHPTNANIDIITSELSAADGAMELMKSFRTSCGNKLNSMEHADCLDYGQYAGSVQHSSDVAQGGLMRLCQEEDISSDQEQLMYESKALHEIQLLGEGKELIMQRSATSPTDAESEYCRRQQLPGDHPRINALSAMRERLPSPVDQVNIQDQLDAGVLVSRKDEGGKPPSHAGDDDGVGMHAKTEEKFSPQIGPKDELGARKKMKVFSTISTQKVGGQQLLQLHAEEYKSASMDDRGDHCCTVNE